MGYHVLAAIPCRPEQRERLQKTGGESCRFVFYPALYENWPGTLAEAALLGGDFLENVKKADIIIGEPPLSLVRELSGGRLRWVQMSWAGTDIYTLGEEAAGENPFFTPDPARRIRLTNASGAFGAVIAEYVLGGILCLYRKFSIYQKQKEMRLWQKAGLGGTLEGKQVLILGTGDIGTQTAKRLKAFGVYTVGYRRRTELLPESFDEVCGREQLFTELTKADVVVGCLPARRETAHLLTERELRAMKADAVLVNVGRGSLIDAAALARVMGEGRLLGAVLDVTEPEPLPESHPLWSLANVLITPHISGESFGHCPQTEDKILAICCENLRRVLEEDPRGERQIPDGLLCREITER